MPSRSFRQCYAKLLLLASVLLGGCGGASDSATADEVPSTEPAPDPKYASAEALLVHARGLLTAGSSDLAAYYALFYWETDDQRVWQRYIQDTAVPSELLNQALEARFGLSDVARPGAHARATITNDALTIEGARATAEFLDGFKKLRTLQLVKVGNRWWISGYSFEATGRDILAKYRQQTIAFIDDFNDHAARNGHRRNYEELNRRLRAGEFNSFKEFKAAMTSAMGGV